MYTAAGFRWRKVKTIKMKSVESRASNDAHICMVPARGGAYWMAQQAPSAPPPSLFTAWRLDADAARSAPDLRPLLRPFLALSLLTGGSHSCARGVGWRRGRASINYVVPAGVYELQEEP